MNRQWILDKLSAGDGSIRKLWGHRLMKFGIVLVLLDIIDGLVIMGHEIFKIQGEGVGFDVYGYVFGTALVLLGVGNVTDIWKLKYTNGQTSSDTSK